MNDEEFDYEEYLAETVCHTCGKKGIKGVAAIPFIPMSVTYCQECLSANAHPYDILVGNTAMCGGELEEMHHNWQDMVRDTLKHLGKTMEEFQADVVKDMAEQERAEKEYFSRAENRE